MACKVKKVGIYGTMPVYKAGKRFYGISGYANLTEIIPLIKQTNRKIARISPRYKYEYSGKKIKTIPYSVGRRGLNIAKRIISKRR